jgi:hypothetical protein
MSKIKLGERVNVYFNGSHVSARVVGKDTDGNAICNGSPLFGNVPMRDVDTIPHAMATAGDISAAYRVVEPDEEEISVPSGSVSSEPALMSTPMATKAPASAPLVTSPVDPTKASS